MSMDSIDVRSLVHEQRMEREGKKRCDGCGEWADDVVPSVKEKNMGDSGTGWAFHDCPVRVGNLCGQCREEDGATPEEDF